MTENVRIDTTGMRPYEELPPRKEGRPHTMTSFQPPERIMRIVNAVMRKAILERRKQRSS